MAAGVGGRGGGGIVVGAGAKVREWFVFQAALPNQKLYSSFHAEYFKIYTQLIESAFLKCCSATNDKLKGTL